MGVFSPESRSGGKLRLFILGALMAFGGGYMLMNSVTVTGGSWYIGGYNGFGVTLAPLLLGVGILFFNERSVWGWILTLGSALAIGLGIIMNLNVYFQPTTLWNTIIMPALIVGGLGVAWAVALVNVPRFFASAIIYKWSSAMSDYHVNIFYSEEDAGYIADIPDLQNCAGIRRNAR